MRTAEQVLTQFKEWAQENELVRAAILTSSRANPDRETDILSDYDIEFYVTDTEPFLRSDKWLNNFGLIMVRWPFKPRSGSPEADITRLVIFRDAVRIDFQIHRAVEVAPGAYDDDYKVLIDKDGLLSNLKPPTHTEHFIKRPTRDKYEILVNEFWWNAHYVPKYLKRDQLPFAASMLGNFVRDKYLQTIIEWYIGMQHNWSINTGIRGKTFKRHLDETTWQEYESTFAGPAIQDQWQAFLNSVRLFRKMAKSVGNSLGYEYPEKVDEEMTEYYQWIWSTEIEKANP